jgi:multidrug efflux pump subunit AcrA (membrane-fusion protein)
MDYMDETNDEIDGSSMLDGTVAENAPKAPPPKRASTRGEAVARIIVIILIALFLLIASVNMLGSGGTASGGMPGGAPAGAPSGAAAGARTGGGAPASNAITVSVKKMAPETIRQFVSLNGDVASLSAVNVYPQTGGRVTRIMRSVGEAVGAGQTIAWIDPSRPGAAYAENPVTAPIGGTITSLPINVGETVQTSTAIASIGSLGRLKITIYVAEKYSAFLRVGLPALVSFTSAPNETFDATVSTVSPVVNPSNRTVETTLALQKSDTRIKAGMFAGVQLVIQQRDNTLVVPRSAVKDYNGKSVVYVIGNDGKTTVAKRIEVTAGLSNDSEMEITKGLKPGDQVITAGSVTDGSAVRVAGQ